MKLSELRNVQCTRFIKSICSTRLNRERENRVHKLVEIKIASTIRRCVQGYVQINGLVLNTREILLNYSSLVNSSLVALLKIGCLNNDNLNARKCIKLCASR